MSDPSQHPDLTHLGWIAIANVREACHWAFEAYIHAGTKALLVCVWMPHTYEVGNGVWAWQLRMPGKITVEQADGMDPAAAICWADRIVFRTVKEKSE